MISPRFTLIDGSAGMRLLLSSFIRSRYPQAVIEEVDPFSQTLQGFSQSLSVNPRVNNAIENSIIVIGSIGTLTEARSTLAKLFKNGSQRDCAPVILLVSTELIAARSTLISCGAFSVLRKDTLSFGHFFQTLECALTANTSQTTITTNDERQYGEFAFASQQSRRSLAIDGYRPLAQFSNGQRATVFFAEHISSGKRAVVKVQTVSPISDLPQLQEVCKRAFDISKYRSPHLVEAIDSGISSGFPYVVLEYLVAGDLRRRMQSEMDISTKILIGIDILTALAELHRAGYVHADLKPESIFFRADGSVVLIDFNISVRFGSTVGATITGDVLGTPMYMSPEQGAGQAVDASSDLYAVGVVIYELITGSPLFTADTPAQTIYRHIHDEVPLLPPSTRHFQGVLDRMLAKSATERPQSALAARDALTIALQSFTSSNAEKVTSQS